MKAEGIDVCPSSISFDSHYEYDTAFEKHIEQFICSRKAKINAPNFKKVIFLDDGGDFLNLVVPHLERTEGVCGVEQTSSGYHRLLNKQHPFPIVNLARSYAKLQCEPKKIVEVCLQKMDAYLATCEKEIRKVLVIGNGAVGGQIYRILKDRYEITLYDILPQMSDFPSEDLSHQLANTDLIIGCSGKTSVPAKYHPFLKRGCILVSVSSSDREFDAAYLRKKAAKTSNCFDHIIADGIVLLNCGFPIGFDGKEDVDDPHFFQFVRALIISCIAQATEPSSKKGLVPLKPEFQLQLLREFHQLGKFSKERLTDLQALLVSH
jgi:S-adenosylhomocysteine hydrolase